MKIICIGRNYKEHARELGNPLPPEPVFFLKPDTSLLLHNRPFYLPEFSSAIQYETELVIKLCKAGKAIPEKFAGSYFDQIGIGIDFTARDIQNKSKSQGLPWTAAKGFDQAAPLGRFLPVTSFNDIHQIPFHLKLNGAVVQRGNSSDMVFTFEQIISHLSRFMTLKTGDLIFTGTPSGVGAVKIGDRLEAFIGDERLLAFSIK